MMWFLASVTASVKCALEYWFAQWKFSLSKFYVGKKVMRKKFLLMAGRRRDWEWNMFCYNHHSSSYPISQSLSGTMGGSLVFNTRVLVHEIIQTMVTWEGGGEAKRSVPSVRRKLTAGRGIKKFAFRRSSDDVRLWHFPWLEWKERWWRKMTEPWSQRLSKECERTLHTRGLCSRLLCSGQCGEQWSWRVIKKSKKSVVAGSQIHRSKHTHKAYGVYTSPFFRLPVPSSLTPHSSHILFQKYLSLCIQSAPSPAYLLMVRRVSLSLSLFISRPNGGRLERDGRKNEAPLSTVLSEHEQNS